MLESLIVNIISEEQLSQRNVEIKKREMEDQVREELRQEILDVMMDEAVARPANPANPANHRHLHRFNDLEGMTIPVNSFHRREDIWHPMVRSLNLPPMQEQRVNRIIRDLINSWSVRILLFALLVGLIWQPMYMTYYIVKALF